MRIFYVFLLLIIGVSPVIGQVGLDTLGLTGTMADTVVANRLFGEMKAFIKEKKWGEAEEKGDQVKEIYSRTFGKVSSQMANIWHQFGLIAYNKKDFQTSKLLWEKALDIRIIVFGPVHSDIADTYNNIGVLYKSNQEYSKAIEYYHKSIQTYLKITNYEHLALSNPYFNLGNTYEILGEYSNSIKYQLMALDIRNKILGPDHQDVLNCYRSLGVVYRKNGEYDKSIELLQKSLEARLKIFGPMHIEIANSYSSLATSYTLKGELDAAIKLYQKALDIILKNANPNKLSIADVYNNIGNVYIEKCEYARAHDYYQKSLNIRLIYLNAGHISLADSYNNLGTSFHGNLEYDKAILCFQKAQEIYVNALGHNHSNVAITYTNLSSSYGQTGDYTKSIELSQKSIDVFIQTLGRSHPNVAHSYTTLGNQFNKNGDYDKAIESTMKALESLIEIFGPEHTTTARAYNNLGNSYRNKGVYDKALSAFASARKSCRFSNESILEIISFEEFLRSIQGTTKILQKQFNETPNPSILRECYFYTLQSLAALAFQQTSFIEESSKSFWQSKNYPIYEQAISVSLLKAEVDQNDTLRHNAFSYAEKSKASLLQAQIKAADAINFSGIPDSLLQKEHNLRIDITWREKQRQSLLDKGLTETDTNTLRISSILFDLKNNYEALKKRFETDYPEYYRLKYDLSTVSLQYVQDTLLEPKNQALLEYFVGDSSIYLFVVRPDTMIVQEVKRDFPLEDWIEKYRQGLYGYYTADKGKRDTALFNSTVRLYADYGQKLHQKLFAPVEQWLPKKVIIVPDGPLGYVPFDALLTSKPEDPLEFKSYPYLLNKYQFSYTYSATLLKEMRDKKHHHEPVKEFAAFAPFYNGDTTLLAGMYQYDDLMRKDLQPLAYSGPEVAAASKLMRGETIAGPAATEERFTSTAGDYRILHLATHGRADNRVGDYAFLAFSEIKDSIENELLYVKDLYNLELNADLVVLSACETGIGKLQRGEGIISLARAFAYAGAKSIVTTLWEVNDKSTSELMRYFYRELKLGKNKDEALRLARQRYFDKAAPRGLHPFFWAAFVPVGDMRPVR